MGEVQNGPVKVFVMALGFATMAAFQLMDYDVVFIKQGISRFFAQLVYARAIALLCNRSVEVAPICI